MKLLLLAFLLLGIASATSTWNLTPEGRELWEKYEAMHKANSADGNDKQTLLGFLHSLGFTNSYINGSGTIKLENHPKDFDKLKGIFEIPDHGNKDSSSSSVYQFLISCLDYVSGFFFFDIILIVICKRIDGQGWAEIIF
uniref:Peptidase_M14 domain-containing protein n=1 Tax=Steinernema glaseri TaxID=37863 RepID=A0A1I7YUC3_9BILA